MVAKRDLPRRKEDRDRAFVLFAGGPGLLAGLIDLDSAADQVYSRRKPNAQTDCVDVRVEYVEMVKLNGMVVCGWYDGW